MWRDFGRDLVNAFRGKSAETRAITSLPWTPFNVGAPANYGSSTDAALSLIPYFACVRILAEQISALPLQTFREDGPIRVKITDPALIRKPAAVLDKVTWTRQAVISLATKGNAVGIITGFDGMGFATGVEWLDYEQVYIDETHPTMPVYYWANPTEGYHEIPRERVLHIAWFVPPGHVEGLSPVATFARSIGVGLNTTDYGSSWFSNGGVPPATFKNTEMTITDEQAEEITNRLVRSLRSGRPLTYGADWDFNAVSINPEESQFIQTMRLNATQIAAIFGIPPEWVGGEAGGSLTYNTVEQNGLQVYKYVLLPWLTLLEGALSRLLPERQFVVFNPDGLLRGDTTSRYEAHKIAIEAGFLTVNEVRELENRPPIKTPKPIVPKPIPVPGDPEDPTKTPVPTAPKNGQPAPRSNGIPPHFVKIEV